MKKSVRFAATTILPAVYLIALAGHAQAFGFENVVERAQALSDKEYEAPPQAPEFLQSLEYPEFQAIRFKPQASLWRQGKSRYQVMMMPQGRYYTHRVNLNVLDQEGVHSVPFEKSDFEYPSPEIAKRIPADLGYAGFKLTYPLEGEGVQNQFLVFGGASYFRGVGAGEGFGLSARGIAVDTGLASGEEFPAFTEFWLERPAADSESMVLYGLLDGPSVSGAYKFVIHPGEQTRMDITARLFFRQDIEQVGLAPLTSMFYYGENTARPRGEWRPQVHDSDGLLIHEGRSGEWLWRPLVNPSALSLSFHEVEQLNGFGLIQRDREFGQFEDLEARYERRPSAWVEPKADWGKGSVVLVEIPSGSETNDNVVAFWTPDEAVSAGEEVHFEYSLTFGDPSITSHPSGRAVKTFVGHGNRTGGGTEEGALRFVVDFAGKTLEDLDSEAAIVSHVDGSDGLEVIEHFLEYVEPENVWRLSILAKPAPDTAPVIRGYLALDGTPLTETWTYLVEGSTKSLVDPE